MRRKCAPAPKTPAPAEFFRPVRLAASRTPERLTAENPARPGRLAFDEGPRFSGRAPSTGGNEASRPARKNHRGRCRVQHSSESRCRHTTPVCRHCDEPPQFGEAKSSLADSASFLPGSAARPPAAPQLCPPPARRPRPFLQLSPNAPAQRPSRQLSAAAGPLPMSGNAPGFRRDPPKTLGLRNFRPANRPGHRRRLL